MEPVATIHITGSINYVICIIYCALHTCTTTNEGMVLDVPTKGMSSLSCMITIITFRLNWQE